MLKRMSRPGRWARALCWAGGLALAAGASAVQAQAPPIELDLQALLDQAGQGGQQRFQDSAWDLRPEQGRRIVLVPIRATPGDAPYELSRPAIGLRTARFIGWYVPDASAAGNRAGNRGANDDSTFRVGGSTDIEELLLGERSGDDRGRDELAGQLDAVDNATDGRSQSDVPEDAPRLARKLEIHPDGTVAWGMDRGFSGATPTNPSQQNRYGYKLDPEAVQNQEPDRLERLERQAGESSRDYAQRRREQAEAHRAALDEYRALREMIRELPDEFQEPLPEVIYAVYDAPQSDELSFTGDNNMRWELSQEKLDALATIARPQGGAGQLSPQTAEAALVVNDMVGRGNELDARIAALAVYQGKLAQQIAQQNDAGYLLVRTLLANDDAQARNATLTSIARVQPPTRISAQLLAEAARNATGDDADALQLAALRSAFRIETGQDGNAGSLLAQANDALAATAGPPAHRVLEELISATEPASHSAGRGGGLGGAPDAAQVAMLVSRIDFAQIKPGQLDDVIAMVIQYAPHSPVAAGWLDQQLLRSADAQRTDRTLAMLGRADRTSTLVRPLTDELRALVFGAPDNATDIDAQPAPVIDGVIALDSEQHGLVLALTSNDDNRRALAWEALRHFEVRDAGNAAGQGQPQGQTGRQVFDRIVDIGLDTESQPDTPPSLVDFIDNPAQGTLAAHARVRMLELLLTDELDPAVARRAARKVTGTGRDYSQPLAALDPAQRAAAVARVYELLTGEAPAIVALLQDPAQSQLTQWLANQWQQGTLPTPAQWARAAGDSDTLLRLAGSANTDVANAAAAAMVLQFGGTEEHQSDFKVALARLSDNSTQAIAAAWEPVKRDIFATRLSETEGAYRMVLTLYPQGYAQTPGLSPAGPGRPAPGPNPNGRAPSQLAEPALTPGRPGRGEPGRGAPGRGGFPSQGNPGTLGPGTPGTPGTPNEPLDTIDLGIIQLSVTGDQVALSIETVPLKLAEDILALQLEDVSTLTTFNHPDLADLPLSQLKEPLNLLPVDDNTWTGHLQLPDGRVLEVSLKRE